MSNGKQYFDSLWDENIIAKSIFLELFRQFDRPQVELSNFINGTARPRNFDKFRDYNKLTPAQGLSIICGYTPLRVDEVAVTDIMQYSKYLGDRRFHERTVNDLAFFQPHETGLIINILGDSSNVTTYERLDGFSTYKFLACLVRCPIKERKQHPIEILGADLKRLIGHFNLCTHAHTIMFNNIANKFLAEMLEPNYPLKQYVAWAEKEGMKSVWLEYLFEIFNLLPAHEQRKRILDEWMREKGHLTRDDIPMTNPQIWAELNKINPRLFSLDKKAISNREGFFQFMRNKYNFAYKAKHGYKSKHQKLIETH